MAKKKITVDFGATEEIPEKVKKKSTEETPKEEKKKRVSHRSLRKPKLHDVYNYRGERLTHREAKFIDEYMVTMNQRQSALNAGYTQNPNAASQAASDLLNTPKIAEEIKHRMEEHKKKGIADREEILTFFSEMMRGNILDQFDLPTNNGDKLKAASELARRQIDVEDRIREKKETAAITQAPEIKISLKWDE